MDVFHQRRRVLKDLVVNALEDVADGRAALVEDGGVGIVDMPVAVRFGAAELAVNLELARDGAQVMWGVGRHLRRPACTE